MFLLALPEYNWTSALTAQIMHEGRSDSLIPETINKSTQTLWKDIQAHKAYIVNTHKGQSPNYSSKSHDDGRGKGGGENQD